MLLSIAYLRTRALWLPWGIHFGWNLTLGMLFGLPVSGLRLFNVVVRTTASGPRWVTGGSYGVEASVTGGVVVLVGIAVVWKLPFAKLRSGAATMEDRAHRDRPLGIQPQYRCNSE